MKTFTIQEIKNYILSQNSLGDVLYNLSEDNINNAQPLLLYTTENTFDYFVVYNDDLELRLKNYVNLIDLNEDEISELLEDAFSSDFEMNGVDKFNVKCSEGIYTISRSNNIYEYNKNI